MQKPTQARRKAGPQPTIPSTPGTPGKPLARPKAKPVSKAMPEPTIRDDAWWIARMQAWREAMGDAAVMPNGKLAFWLAMDVDDKPNDGDPVVPTNLDAVLDRWVEGETLRELAAYVSVLFGFRVSHASLRRALTNTPEGLAKYHQAREHLAHRLVEQALGEAELASKAGDHRFAADFRLKLAGKLRPEDYGDRTRLDVGGIKGRPIEQAITQTPADAYKAVLEGGVIPAGGKP